jgi:hypothetical protein
MKGSIMKEDLVARFALASALAISGLMTVEHYSHHGRNESKVSASMPDGTKYAAISPDTDKPMFATPSDAPGTYSWTAGMKYCGHLNAYGHKDWRMPTKGELNVLFQNQAAIGGFNEAGWHPLDEGSR